MYLDTTQLLDLITEQERFSRLLPPEDKKAKRSEDYERPFVEPLPFTYQIPGNLKEDVDFIIRNSLEPDFADFTTKLLCRHLDRGTYADDKHQIYRQEAESASGKKYSPSWLAMNLALKRRYIVFFNNRYKSTKIMMIDLDTKNAQFAWCYAGLKQPFLIITNPISGKCQYWYILDQAYSKEHYYIIRDSMLNKLAPHVKVDRKNGDKGIDYSKPEVCRSPLFNPYKNKAGTKKRVRSTFKKDEKIQADYTNIIMSTEFRVYSLMDLDARPLTLDQIDWSSSSISSRLSSSSYHHQSYNKGIDRKGATPNQHDEKPSRHLDMVAAVEGKALKLYVPVSWSPENVVKQKMYEAYKSHADPTLPEDQIWASVDCTYRKGEASWDASKRGKSQGNGKRSPEKQKFRSDQFWNTERMFRELLVDYANENAVPYVTVRSWHKAGKLKMVGGKWVKSADETVRECEKRTGTPYRTLKRWKAQGELTMVNGLWTGNGLKSLADSPAPIEAQKWPFRQSKARQ